MIKLLKRIFALLIVALAIFVLFHKTGVSLLLFDCGTYPPVANEYEVVSDLEQLSPKTRELATLFLQRCAEEGLPVKITETYRTQARQDQLYALGRSQPGNIVTWTKNSKHTKRRAFDIAKIGDDPYGDEEFFRRCALIGKEVGLKPGYYFRNYQDKPHFELNTWLP
ncbi:MAG: M15 family metallopeptidase [Peptoniphilus sp.]|nr:M15 family metallopeptidase [Peptoniphilus sp.]